MKKKIMKDLQILAALKRIYVDVVALREKGNVDLTRRFCLLSELEDQYERIYGKIALNDPESLKLTRNDFKESKFLDTLDEDEVLCIPAHIHEGVEIREKDSIEHLLTSCPKRWISCEKAGMTWYLDQERITEEELWK